MATIPFKRVDDAEGLTKEIYENIMRTYGSDEPHGIYQLMGHTIALSVAATCGNDHLIEAHQTRLEDLGLSDVELVELLLVIDLTCGYNRYVQGLQANIEAKPFGEDAVANQAASLRS